MNLKPPSIAVSRNTSGYRLGRGAGHELHPRIAVSPSHSRYRGRGRHLAPPSGTGVDRNHGVGPDRSRELRRNNGLKAGVAFGAQTDVPLLNCDVCFKAGATQFTTTRRKAADCLAVALFQRHF